MNYFIINIIVSVIFFFLLLGKDIKEKRIIYYLIAFFFILFIGLRGSDDEYTKSWVFIPTLDLFFVDNMFIGYEKGMIFYFIASTIKTLGFNSQGLLLFFSFSSILIHVKYYRIFSQYYILAFLLYISHEIIFHEWTQIRAGLASAMVLPMIYNLQLGKKKTFFILYIISSLIHYVSIISILLLFICRPIKTKWLYLGICLAFVILYSNVVGVLISSLEGANLLPSRVQLYLGWERHTYAAGLMHPKTFQQIITSLFTILLFSRNNNSLLKNTIINTYILSTILQIALNDYSIFAFRSAGHFYVVEPLIITYLISFFKEKKLVLSICVIFCIFLSYLNYVKLERLEPYDLFVNPSSLKW